MFYISYFLLCFVVLSCNAYLRCDNPPHRRQDGGVTKWPANTVPYEISDEYTSSQKDLIRNSLREVTEKTDNCVKFTEKTDSDPAWVRVVNKQGCWSKVGKSVESGFQELSLQTDGCMWKTTVMHEFMHSLGFVHEQTRPDRDNYVRIMFENVQEDMKHNFEKNPQGALQSFGLPYDFDSVMHYVCDGFSINCLPTIIPVEAKSKQWRYNMGKAKELSAADIYKIKKIYGCI